MTLTLNDDVLARLDAVDPDRMRAARLADPDVRGHLFALYAFHAELAKVPEVVSEPMLGQIRYQWWRDCIGEIYGGGPVRAHEVSTPLSGMVRQSGISRFLLDRIIDGRERDLDPRPFADIAAATDYADATSGALAQAAITLCGGESGLMAGRAWGLTGLARSYRYYADGMLKELSFDDLLTAASEAYDAARAETLPMPAAAYVALVPGFIKRMRRGDYHPREHVPSYPPFLKQMRMVRAVAVGRV